MKKSSECSTKPRRSRPYPPLSTFTGPGLARKLNEVLGGMTSSCPAGRETDVGEPAVDHVPIAPSEECAQMYQNGGKPLVGIVGMAISIWPSR